MQPYFFTNHVAGLLMAVVVSAWGMMELSQRSANRGGRQGAIKIGGAGSRLAFKACLIATVIVVNLAPHVFPAATIRSGAVAFAAGLVILLAGLVLRGWSFKTLGQYFTHIVMVSSDQPVITAGPYRLLRHPGYTAVLLIGIGAGLASANWAALGAVTLLILTPLLWRTHIEEHVLAATLGHRYRAYSAQHKRLVALIW